MPSLSFCIPTRNFGPFIGATIEHLLREIGPADEIVIVDGNSSDNTAEVVALFQEENRSVRYERLATNGGVDRDLALAVSLARCDYCWLFSADDGLVNGAVERARTHLTSGCDVLLVDRIECDLQLRPLWRRRWTRQRDVPIDYRLADEASFRAYIANVRSLGGLFSYISSIVVRRAAWAATEPNDRLIGTHYAHVGRLLKLLQQHGRVLRIAPLALVLSRGENDSFAQAGRVNRFLIDVEGYSAIAQEAFSEYPARARPFCAAFRRDHDLGALAGVRMRCESASQWRSIADRLGPLGYSPFKLALAGALGRARPLVVAGRLIRNHILRWFGSLGR